MKGFSHAVGATNVAEMTEAETERCGNGILTVRLVKKPCGFSPQFSINLGAKAHLQFWFSRFVQAVRAAPYICLNIASHKLSNRAS